MFDLQAIYSLFAGGGPQFGNLRKEPFESLPSAGLPLGTLIIGRPGTGKTSTLARQVVKEFLYQPEQAIFVLDWSGAITDSILQILLQQNEDIREGVEDRIVYDELGHHEWAVPLPEFSEEYGSQEEQCQRVASNLAKLAPHLVANAPILGGAGIREIAPQIFRLLCAITNEHGESWQITEAKRLVWDGGLMTRALNKYGYKFPEAKYFLERVFMEIKANEKELRTYALMSLLGAIEAREIRARIGYYRPGWTPREAIEKGLLVIINGAGMINQPNAQHYLFTQVYSLIMQEINKRIPGDPKDQPVSLVLDEVYSLIGIPGMAEEIGKISPLYRSRKLQLYIVLQSLSQLAKPLDEQIWSLGNKVVFALENKDDAEKIARQLFKYDPRFLKQPPRTPHQNPITEPQGGQDRLIADWIQNLKFRECLIRRFISERELDPFVRHISKTKDLPGTPMAENLITYKQRMLQKRAVRVRDALDTINQRSLTIQNVPPSI